MTFLSSIHFWNSLALNFFVKEILAGGTLLGVSKKFSMSNQMRHCFQSHHLNQCLDWVKFKASSVANH